MRIDAARHAARLGLAYEGPCTGGEIGAGYVRWPDGRRGVLSEGNPASTPLLGLARAAGIPAPSYDLIDGRVVVQSLLPGRPPERVDQRLVDEMTAVSRRFAGLLRATEVPPLHLYLHQPGPGFCHHDSLAQYSARSAALLSSIRRVALDTLPGDDLVHVDFHPGNVLVAPDGALTGIVDWDGAGRGTRAFDLVTLLFYVCRRAPALAPPLAAEAARLAPPEVLEACWAHMSLRQVDWSIRFHDPAEADAWLAVAENPPADLR
ncbi:aminoglycoside phosphotransferase family protein [Dactylosporangium salmoneum]|uniref:Aminoglycoside phosphotransferase domain-containing protein n=1 Tax=Dactylosporangium salmoneum TaxID=53361 RepID=A0ABP5UTV7_9ACTN